MQEAPPLTPRDWQILEHVFRYRMTTRDVLFRLFFEPAALKSEALTSVLRGIAAPNRPGLSEEERRKLAEPYYLRPQQLYRKVIYYHLSRRGGRAVASTIGLPPGVPEKLDKPLTYDARAKRYSTLIFCCFGKRKRQKLTYDEFATKLTDYHVPGCPKDSYYMELNGPKPRLGFIRIDYAKLQAKAYVRKCYDDVIKRLAHDRFRSRIEQGLFVVSLLTPTEPRRLQLDEAIEDLHDPDVAGLIETEVVSDLNNVLHFRQGRR